MKKNISAIITGAICILGIIILSVALNYFGGRPFYRNETIISLDTSMGMSSAQREKDFGDLCVHLEKNVPMLHEYEKLHGIKYEDIKEYYKQLINQAQSDYDYYAYIDGFLNNIPSGHLSIGYPNIEQIPFVLSYSLKDISNFDGVQNYWENILHNECKKHYESNENTIIFVYCDGNYIGSSGSSENDVYSVNNAELLTINGVSIDEFIRIYPTIYKLKYDHINEKSFREMLLFNDRFGEKCTIEYSNSKGEILTREMYCSTTAEEVLSYIEYFKTVDTYGEEIALEKYSGSDENTEEVDFTSDYITNGNVTAIKDSDSNTLYLEVRSFAPNSNLAAEILTKSEYDCDNVIIDLRNNIGGYTKLSDKLISAISTEDIIINDTVYITKNKYKSNTDYYDEELVVNDSKEINGLKQLARTEIIKAAANEKKNYYLLISDVTLSAADRFTAIFKDNNLGTVIGMFNTQGERYGSPEVKVLNRSGIYFYFTEFKYLNPDGSDNSVYGTAPHIYVNDSIEKFTVKSNMILSGEDPFTYENRLKWDNVLIETLEIINENTQ